MESLREVIREAERKKTAIGHFNVSNLEQLKATENVIRRLGLPVIIGVSEGEREFIGVSKIAALVKNLRGEGLLIFLNADHTLSLEKVEEAAYAGFDAVLFDGARLPFEENIKKTKEAVKTARAISKEILVEGELGFIGSSSEIFAELPVGAVTNPENFTKPEEAARFVKETGVDLFTPAVGNVHGMFKSGQNQKLDIQRIKEIKDVLPVPLVLHGGSGVSDEDFLEAIDAGISIIHISTELRAVWRGSLEESLGEKPEEIAPYKIESEVIKRMEELIERRLKLFSKI